MKKPLSLLLVAALAAASAFAADKKEKPASNVTVTFTDPDNFTDARSTFGMGTDQYYLDVLSEHIQKYAGRRLAAGQKLEVTIKDVDLAGEFLPTHNSADQVRVIKEIFVPRVTLAFKLTGADGRVLKEGERRLQDLNFMSNLSINGRNEPLFYDKALLTDWISREFKS